MQMGDKRKISWDVVTVVVVPGVVGGGGLVVSCKVCN